MTTYLQVEAIVLHTRDFGEKDALLTLLSKERGKFSLICKGVKKPASRMRSAAQLFTHARFFLYEGKSLAVATQAQTIESFRTLADDLKKFAAASYWAELTGLLLPEKEMNFHGYLLLVKALRLLDANFSWALFYAYQIKLLSLTGYQPELENCILCGKQSLTEKYLSPAEGGVLCKTCSQGRLNKTREGVIQVLKLFKTAPLETIIKLQLSATVRKELHKFIKEYIQHRTESTLRSEDFLFAIE